MVAFPAYAVLVAHARSFVSSMMQELAIENTAAAGSPSHPSIWAAFMQAGKHSPVVLESLPLMLIFKEQGKALIDVQSAGRLGCICHHSMHGASNSRLAEMGAASLCRTPALAPMGRQRFAACRLKHTDMKEMVPKLCDELPSVCWPSIPAITSPP